MLEHSNLYVEKDENTSSCIKYAEYGVGKGTGNNKNIYKLNLTIPDYQRIYTWEYEQVKTLLDDIVSIKLEKYFIGAIILHYHQGKSESGHDYVYDIVDGQQRLVTIALIKYALSQVSEYSTEGLDRFLNCKFASLEAQYHVQQNLSTINNYIADSQRRALILDNIDNLSFGVLIIEEIKNLDKAFTFFSNSNSKGIKLTDYDLLKPHHLRYIPADLPEQQMHLAKKWDKMICDNPVIDINKRQEVDYIRLLEVYIYRLRNWMKYKEGDESAAHYIKKEYEAAPIIREIPPFGEQFNYAEPIQGGQHFFAYVDHFQEVYRRFKMIPIEPEKKPEEEPGTKTGEKSTEDKKNTQEKKLKDYFSGGSHAWYGEIIEALVFCYYLKFGESYIYEAIMSITRYVAIIRFRLGRAYKPTLFSWANRSRIAMEIDRATSPTFFLASIEKLIDNPPSNPDKKESAEKGIRKDFLRICRSLTNEMIEKSTVNYYKNYTQDRYGQYPETK